MNLLPMISFDSVDLRTVNECLQKWGHRMGQLRRPNYSKEHYHALFHEGDPVAICTASTLIRESVGGVLGRTRDNTIELSRLCAARKDLNRVALRLWREFVFPTLGYQWAISYQDSVIHSGDLYRFDGWQRFPVKSRSGTDARTGRTGRSKWIWGWPVDPSIERRPRAATTLRVADEQSATREAK